MKFLTICGVVVLLLVAGLAVACSDGDGGSLSLEEYFQQLDEAQNGVDQRFDDFFQQEEPGPDASEEDIAAFAHGVVQAFATILGDAEGTFGDLEPPAEAEDPHNDLLEAIGDSRAALEGAEDDIPDALSLEELETFDPFAEAEDAFGRVDAACKELQTIADDSSIDVDLECEEE